MPDLATADDVAQALGLGDASELSEAEGNRVDGLLSRVSRDFRREAEREFTPGTTTVRVLTAGSRVRLPEPITSVTSATMRDRNNDVVTLSHDIDGQELIVEYGGRPLWSGVPVTVTYTHSADVPASVVADVAAIVARHLTIDPLGPDRQSTELTIDDYRQRFAGWVSSNAVLTSEECETARSYRYPGSAIIIQKP